MKLVLKLNGEKLRTARFMKGWNQAELAKAAGLTQGMISQAENGRPVHPANAEKIWTALELEPKELVIPSRRRRVNGHAA